MPGDRCSLLGATGTPSTAIPEPATTTAGTAGGTGLAGSLGVLTTGCAVLVVAVFAPFVFLRLFPLADADATEGARRAISDKARRAAAVVTKIGGG